MSGLTDENGIGEIYRCLREGVRGMFFAQAYKETVAYVRRLEGGRLRTVLLVEAVPGDDAGGVKFLAHATRFEQHKNVPIHDLRSWLPDNTTGCDHMRRWNVSFNKERESAEGLEGLFHRTDGVDGFVTKLSSALERRAHPSGKGVA